jgi:NDP-sugar pyrophosphorylase family protein
VYEKEGRVEQVVEKPAPGTSRTNWMNAGLFVAKPSLFDYLDQLEPSERGEYELPDAFNRLIEEGRRVYAAPLEGVWSDLGRPSQVLWTDGEVMKYDKRLCTLPEPNALVHISPEAHVGPCRFEGIVAVAQKAEVEAGCTLANVAILGETYIETHSELRNCLVAPGAYIRSGERHIGSPEEPAIVMPTGAGPW